MVDTNIVYIGIIVLVFLFTLLFILCFKGIKENFQSASIKKLMPPAPFRKVYIYSDRIYNGSFNTLSIGDYPASFDFGLGDNDIESISIGPGVKVTLYKDPNYEGENIELLGPYNIPDLSTFNMFSNVVSSIKVSLPPPPAPGPSLNPTPTTVGSGSRRNMYPKGSVAWPYPALPNDFVTVCKYDKCSNYSTVVKEPCMNVRYDDENVFKYGYVQPVSPCQDGFEFPYIGQDPYIDNPETDSNYQIAYGFLSSYV